MVNNINVYVNVYNNLHNYYHISSITLCYASFTYFRGGYYNLDGGTYLIKVTTTDITLFDVEQGEIVMKNTRWYQNRW